MINVNHVLTPNREKATLPFEGPRIVIWAEPTTDRLFLMALHGRAYKPVAYPYQTVRTWLDQGLLIPGELTLDDQYERNECSIPEKSRRMRDVHFEIIRPIVENLDEFLIGAYGSNIVAERAALFGKTEQQVYNYVYAYLRGGQTRDALLPGYLNGKSWASRLENQKKSDQVKPDGKPRKKRGAPPRTTPYHGKNITAQDVENIEEAVKEHYIKYKGMSLRACREEMKRAHYRVSVNYKPDGRAEYQFEPPDNIPTMHQFYYWARKYLKPIRREVLRIRRGKSVYDKDLRGRSGDPVRGDGPGHIYQLDATEHELELVSPIIPGRVQRISRATLYKVVDTFSGMTAGIHLTLAPPSWAAAKVAIFNAFRDKRAFCSELGLQINRREWLVQGRCHTLFVDNGELQNQISEPGVQDGGFTVVFGRAYRGDDKGLVEDAMKRGNVATESVPGSVRGRVRGEPEPGGPQAARQQACLTPRDLYRLLIVEILHRNNKKAVPAKYLTAQMARDDVKPIPRNMWLWGLRNVPCLKASPSDTQLYLRMMEKGEATIHQDGLYFDKTWYRCPWTLERGLQDRKPAGNKAQKIEVRHHRYNCDVILVVTSEGLQPAYLMEDRFLGCTRDEVHWRLKEEKRWGAKHEPRESASRASADQYREDTVKKARRGQKKLPKASVARQSVSDNAKDVIAAEQRADAERYGRYMHEEYTQPQPPSAAPVESAAGQDQRGGDDDSPRDDDFDNALSNL